MRQYTFLKTGLRFDIDHLNRMRKTITQMPIEQQAEYVDAITHGMVARSNYIGVDPATEVSKDDSWNTSSVGNTAYIALYHPNPTERQNAKLLLEKFRLAFA